MNCSDDVTNSFFNDLGYKDNIVLDMNVVLYFSIALISLDVVLVLLWFFMVYLPNKLASDLKKERIHTAENIEDQVVITQLENKPTPNENNKYIPPDFAKDCPEDFPPYKT